MITATCPSWCETNHPDYDVEPDAHDGPYWGWGIGAGAFGDPLSPLAVYTDDPQVLTPNEAREVARRLYEAAAWVEDQRKT
jgi:hypothetical protein